MLLLLTYICSSLVVIVVQQAEGDAEAIQQRENQRDKNTTKDDIARLLHLFKEPSAQIHWSNLYGILNRMQLDSRKSSGEQSEAARPLACLAEIFNDYQGFHPQNVMVQYVSRGSQRRPVKKQPYQPSSPEWAVLANHCHDIEPTNESRRHIIRAEDWIKETWNDCRKYLHQTFLQYNRSGQHDPDRDEWCSQKELERWVRATTWKTAGANSVIRFPTAMVYSIAVLEEGDFDSIGRQMPSGTGVDASMDGAATTGKKRKKRGKYKKHNKRNNNDDAANNNTIATVIESIGSNEARMSALRLLIEFGSAAEKRQALQEVKALAYRQAGNAASTTTSSEGNDVAAEEEDGAGTVSSSTSSDDSDSSL